MLLFSFFLNIFLCQGYELSGEIALKNNHYYYYYYIVLAYLMLFAALTNSVCLNNASFFFLFKYFLCQGYELSGEIALKNNHYYYYYI